MDAGNHLGENELEDLLKEFEDVIEDFKAPAPKNPSVYERHLQEAKQQSGTDSGFSDTDHSGVSSAISSLNNSEENLNNVDTLAPSKAKLGDTRDLENFIENLDKELAVWKLANIYKNGNK
ncbi:regulator of cell cycle RGCC-like isoform X1 [Erpetoichthys calabaricus]|uniref:regulator of cell cycle RGCC-like isoform X1 n=1 Tax=Erpetoichthys calabaricus TaxID=27687 RepID=UPI002234694F|nr:regulator of cell cycle RGCC-like isoform X1 [Erpetoichthys calabaricus]